MGIIYPYPPGLLNWHQLGQSYDHCPSVSQVTLEDMSKIRHYRTTIQRNKGKPVWPVSTRYRKSLGADFTYCAYATHSRNDLFWFLYRSIMSLLSISSELLHLHKDNQPISQCQWINPEEHVSTRIIYHFQNPMNQPGRTCIQTMNLQYIPRNMHTVFALLCFVVVIHWLIFPYPSGLLHWHCGNLTIVPVPAKQPWWIWINTSCEFIMNDCITTTKQSTTKPCAYFLGYTVSLPKASETTLKKTYLRWAPHKTKTKHQIVFYINKQQCSEFPTAAVKLFLPRTRWWQLHWQVQFWCEA